MAALQAFAEKTDTPVALTLLGLGGFPASHPLCLGMMGMHGEAYVNTAIQEADLLLAFGMRFDDRVTGNLKTYAPGRGRSTSRSTPARWARTSPWTWHSWAISARSSSRCCRRWRRRGTRPGARGSRPGARTTRARDILHQPDERQAATPPT